MKIRVSSPGDALASGLQELTLEVGSVDYADQVSGASGVYLIDASVLEPYPQSPAQVPPDYTVTVTATNTPK